jgi:2,3-dihydroxyphenylpropionate 1,2-dioxygenase
MGVRRLAAGNLKSLIGYDEDELDRAGNIELRCWAAAAGMLGERKPDIVSMDPSWHHNYASLGWWGGPPAPAELHYPACKWTGPDDDV